MLLLSLLSELHQITNRAGGNSIQSIPIPTPIHITKVNHKIIRLMCTQGVIQRVMYWCIYTITILAREELQEIRP